MTSVTTSERFRVRQQTTTAVDGTLISWLTLGNGPGLIIVPGALAIAEDYLPLANGLAGAFTVHIVDRRGHGRSGPQGADYGINKDVEDIRAVQRESGAESLFGHSFGGLVSLEAARSNSGIKRLAVYEPGVSIEKSIPADWMPAYQAHLDAGQDLEAFIDFAVGMGPRAIKRMPRWLMRRIMRAALKDEWDKMAPLLGANLAEHREVVRLNDSYRHYAEITADTLLISGGNSPATGKQTLATLARTIPSARVDILPKLNHFGPTTHAPDVVAREIQAFLLGN